MSAGVTGSSHDLLDDLLDDSPSKEQNHHTQGASADTSEKKTPISKINGNTGYKTVGVGVFETEQLDQDRCLKECMETVSLPLAFDTELRNVVVKDISESELVLKNQMGQGISPHKKLTSDVGCSVGKVSKIVSEESYIKAISADEYNSMGEQVYPLPVIGHLSDFQTRGFYEDSNEKGQEWTWPEQDLGSKGANLDLEASKQLYKHNWPKMNEQMPNEVGAGPKEITPKCIVNKGSDCHIVGRKILNTMDEESRHSRWEEFRRFASRDTTTEDCSTLLKKNGIGGFR